MIIIFQVFYKQTRSFKKFLQSNKKTKLKKNYDSLEVATNFIGKNKALVEPLTRPGKKIGEKKALVEPLTRPGQ